MAGTPIWIILAFLTGGGGSDLLDYVSPDVYWKDKQVQVTVDAMAGELKPAAAADVSRFLDDLNSPDAQVRQAAAEKIVAAGPGALPQLREASKSTAPQIASTARALINRIEQADRAASVRRLMAIRMLGQMKDKQAAELLRPLLTSDEPMVADYAAAAIDQLDGKPARRRHPENLRDDVWLLPDGSRAVGQLLAPSEVPPGLAQQLKKIVLPPGQDAAAMEQQITRALTPIAEALGNVRLDAISFGVAGDVGDKSGYVVLIARAKYDSRAAADFLHKQNVPSSPMGTAEVFQPAGAQMRLCFPSSEYAVLIASPRDIAPPMVDVLNAISTRQSKLKEVAEMKRLIENVPADQPLWATMKVTPAYAQASLLAPFETVDLRSAQQADGTHLTITGNGSKPDAAKNATQMINGGIANAVDQLRRQEQFMPSFKAFADALQTAKCDANQGNATLTAILPPGQSGLLMLPMMFMARATAAPAPPPVQVAPAPGPGQ